MQEEINIPKKEEDVIKNPQPKMRQVIIETDGNNIKIVKADVAGNLELIAILQTIVMRLNNVK